MRPKRALCVWLPRWPLERLAAARAELNGSAVLLYEQASRGGLRVVAYTSALTRAERAAEPGGHGEAPPARSTGIYPGMPLAEALALHEHAAWSRAKDGANGHAALRVEVYDPVADRLAIRALAHELQQFSPLVGVEEAPRAESLLLDITGVAGLFGGEERLAALIRRHLAELGFGSRVAIADTVGAAWAMAHYGPPASTSIVPPGSLRAALAPLPLAALRLSSVTIEMLAELGAHSIGALLALPRASLHGRFGPETLRRVDEAFAAAADVSPSEKPLELLQAERLFEFPTDRRETIEAAVERLLAPLAGALAGERKGMLRIVCRLGRLGSPAVEFEVSLFRATASPRHALELVALRLDAIGAPWSRAAPVESVRVTVTAAAPLGLEQRTLFEPDNSREAPRQLAALVDRLTNRLGRQAVSRPVLLADAQPEYACQYLPLDEPEPPALCAMPTARRGHVPKRNARPSMPTQSRGHAAQRPSPGARPLCLFSPAQPLGIPAQPLGGTRATSEEPPPRFRFRGQEEQIVRTWGPERIETGWWRGRCARRDYYRIETAGGSRFWVFRRLIDGRWFLHGEFE